MTHRMKAEFAEGDLLHLAIGGMVLDPVLVATEAIARMQHRRMLVGNSPPIRRVFRLRVRRADRNAAPYAPAASGPCRAPAGPEVRDRCDRSSSRGNRARDDRSRAARRRFSVQLPYSASAEDSSASTPICYAPGFALASVIRVIFAMLWRLTHGIRNPDIHQTAARHHRSQAGRRFRLFARMDSRFAYDLGRCVGLHGACRREHEQYQARDRRRDRDQSNSSRHRRGHRHHQ